MLAIDRFREEPERIKDSEERRGKDPGRVDTIIELDEQWRETRQELDNLRHKRNVTSDQIAEKKQGGEDAEDEIARMQDVNDRIDALEDEEQELKQRRDEERYKVGNVPHESVPDGEDEDDNVAVRHWEPEDGKREDAVLGADVLQEAGLIETEKAATMAGERAYFLRNDLVHLNFALIRFAIDLLQERGYTPMQTPYYLNREQMEAAAELEDFHEQLFTFERSDRYLIATSEQPLAAFHFDEILQPDELPKRYAGFSTNFRREAGKHGTETRGIWRVHQFEKVEQFIFANPEGSWELHDELLQNAEDVMQALELPYRVVNVCIGDLGDTAAKKYDIEVWRPPLQEYGEVVSCSNCTDYQARKVKVRMRGEDNPTLHTLNATACATSRVMTAIVENHQEEEGIRIPDALQPYMGGQEFIRIGDD